VEWAMLMGNGKKLELPWVMRKCNVVCMFGVLIYVFVGGV
jgi:hypothetical protein